MNICCELCHGTGIHYIYGGCKVCGKVKGDILTKEEAEIYRLRSIIANRDRKLREWAARADEYDGAVGTMIKIITEELLEDHG